MLAWCQVLLANTVKHTKEQLTEAGNQLVTQLRSRVKHLQTLGDLFQLQDTCTGNLV